MKALINYEVAEAFKEVTGIDVVPLYPYDKLQVPVSAHADMLFCILDKTVFCYEDYVKENNLIFVISYDIIEYYLFLTSRNQRRSL